MRNNTHLKIFTPEGSERDEGAIKQMKTCMIAGDAIGGSLSADHHLGYSAPIGASLAYPNFVSPSGVGYDIGCGNKAVATSLHYQDVREDMPKIMNEVMRRISFGMGGSYERAKDHPIYDQIAHAEVTQQRNLLGKARAQLGTVGSGNHYVDIFREEGTDRIWIGVHFGSRGFGHLTASGFLALAQGLAWDDRAQGGEMNSPPVLLRTDSALGHMYIEAMQLAGEYAYAGRDLVCDEVLDILGAEPMAQVHNHHNFAWLENTPYGKAWVVRKGATPLWPGQRGFVGGSMGENAVIIEGIEAPLAQEALYSAPHGAGRAMSRTEAAGKKRKRTYCRNCGWTQQPGQPRPTDDRCPSCKRYGDLNKKWVTERPGKVDWAGTQKALAFAGIHLRGGGADEAPMAYKRLPDVLAAHAGHIKILHELRPIGVAMAGADIRDPYKDG